MPVEGVTKFSAQHRQHPLPVGLDERIAELLAWRSIAAATDGVGQDPARYDGAGYGNVSARVGPFPGERGRRRFLITATQTGELSCVSAEHLALVSTYDAVLNAVRSEGPRPPSSESMTHGAVYDLAPHLRAVIHVHCPEVFRGARELGLPSTRADVDYGTPEMAREVERLWRTSTLESVGVFVMAGHEDGVVAIGRSLQEAGERLISTMARALAAGYRSDGAVCDPSLRQATARR